MVATTEKTWSLEDLPIEVCGRVVIHESGCWNWTGGKSDFGHGRMHFGGRMQSPHRVVALHCGILTSPDKWAMHRCDNPACVNPAHLFEGTRSDNMRDCYEKGRLPGPGIMRERSDWITLDARAIARDAATKSIRQIGRELGVHHRTVTKALCHHLDAIAGGAS